MVLFSNTSGGNFSVLVEAPPHLSMYPEGTSQDGEDGKRYPEAISGTASRKQVSGERRRGDRKDWTDRGKRWAKKEWAINRTKGNLDQINENWLILSH